LTRENSLVLLVTRTAPWLTAVPAISKSIGPIAGPALQDPRGCEPTTQRGFVIERNLGQASQQLESEVPSGVRKPSSAFRIQPARGWQSWFQEGPFSVSRRASFPYPLRIAFRLGKAGSAPAASTSSFGHVSSMLGATCSAIGRRTRDSLLLARWCLLRNVAGHNSKPEFFADELLHALASRQT